MTNKTPLTAEQLEADLALARAKTPGEWRFVRDGILAYISTNDEYIVPASDKDAYPCNMRNHDGEFIIAAAARFESYILALQEARRHCELLMGSIESINHQSNNLESLFRAAEADNQRLRAALAWYADEENWNEGDMELGDIARKALNANKI